MYSNSITFVLSSTAKILNLEFLGKRNTAFLLSGEYPTSFIFIIVVNNIDVYFDYLLRLILFFSVQRFEDFD